MKTTLSSHDQQLITNESRCNTAHDEIARAAYCLYEKNGSQNGRDVCNWLEAEAHVKAKHSPMKHGDVLSGR